MCGDVFGSISYVKLNMFARMQWISNILLEAG
jgi:hypothetical protein